MFVLEINGYKVKMEERVCSGGCKKKFKCSVSSKAYYARSDCALICKNRIFSENMDGKTILERHRHEALKCWKRNIDICRKLLNEDMEKNRLIIAQMALDSCLDRKDSQHRQKILKGFSGKAFSEEVGLDQKTLQTWMSVKRDVINKLPKSVYNNNYTAARRTYLQITRFCSPERVRMIFDLESG